MKNAILPFALAAVMLATRSTAQTPAPAPFVQFTLPLKDKKTATAVLLPTTDGQAYLVYASSTGQIGSYILTPTSPCPSPTPPPTPGPTPPNPPPPPTPPPTPPAKRPAALITITETSPATIGAAVKQRLTEIDASYYAFTEAMVADESPPANALKWIGRAAGKPKPYSYIADTDGIVMWEGPTPSDAQLLAMLKPATAAQPEATCCPDGVCPLIQKPNQK